MKKDLNDQILSEERLDNVQGGFGGGAEERCSTSCQYPGCGWKYVGTKEKAAIAQHSHTEATGHNHFA